ncbi:MAG: M20/M25/M40 family metallo-hydrolase [Pyrinomonadaceae bacterium]
MVIEKDKFVQTQEGKNLAQMKKPISKIIAALALVILFSTINYAQKISAEEQKIVSYVDEHTSDAIALVEKTVNIESPTENVAGVKQVGMVFKKEFEAIGFVAKWIEMPAGMKRAGHLIAEKNGTKGQRVLLLGHLDTVLSGEKFRRDGNKIYGTGSADMKAGDAVLLYALKALSATGALQNARVIVLLTGDEEDSGEPVEIGRGDMIAAAKRSDLTLSFENGANNIATIARRGFSSWELEVSAKTGHSAGIFKESMGSGAIFEASRIINQFYETLHNEKYLTFNPSVIGGGTVLESKDGGVTVTAQGKLNVVPAKVVVRGDLRFISEEQKETARAKMREIVAKNLPGTTARITFTDSNPAMPPTTGNYALLKQLDQVSQDLGLGKIEPLDPGERGAGDISYISHLLPSMDGLGATGGSAHARGEYAELDTLPTQIKRAALLIYRLTR